MDKSISLFMNVAKICTAINIENKILREKKILWIVFLDAHWGGREGLKKTCK
jgi:hypothetical protein